MVRTLDWLSNVVLSLLCIAAFLVQHVEVGNETQDIDTCSGCCEALDHVSQTRLLFPR